MDCPLRSGHDLADAYVAGTLSESDQDAFEQHFFACAACLAHVQMLQEVKDGLRERPAPPIAHRSPSPGWIAAPWLGLALAASLVAAFGWWWQSGTVTGTPPAGPPVAVGPAAAPTPAPSQPPGTTEPVESSKRRAVLTQLALVVPPRYVPLAVRSGSQPPTGSFDAAMAHYVAGRHGEAAATLRTLSNSRPTDPGIAFFWGISELVRGHPDAARKGLTRAVAAEVQPYADEAHFYLAKAYLAEDAVEPARTELRYAIAHEAGPEGEAQRLLAAIDGLPPR